MIVKYSKGVHSALPFFMTGLLHFLQGTPDVLQGGTKKEEALRAFEECFFENGC